MVEWIGPAVVTYIAKELIQGYRRNRKITRMVDQFEFVIVPVLNADGYVYSWEQDRMWRKNRQPTSIPMCPGIVRIFFCVRVLQIYVFLGALSFRLLTTLID
jgi:hypothetical protein